MEYYKEGSFGHNDSLNHILKGIYTELKTIRKDLKKIMGTQAEFDAQLAELQAATDKLTQDNADTKAAVEAETKEIADYIASQPAGVDTSKLEASLTNLKTAVGSEDGEATNVGKIFTPPTPAPAPAPATGTGTANGGGTAPTT